MCFNSDSQTASTTDSSIGSHNVDGSVNSQNGAAISNSGSNNITQILDGGAIADSFRFADRAGGNALTFAGTAFKDLIGAQSNSLAGILSGVQSTQNFIASTQAQASGQMDNKTKLYMGLAGLAVVGLLIWSTRK
jgi:hypothetical protein